MVAHSFRFREAWLADPNQGFTWRSTLALVSACKIAYHPAREAERLAREDWQVEAAAFESSESQGIILENDRMMVIAFRGTDSTADWLGNLRIAPRFVPSLGGALHRGFLDAYDAVAPVVDAAVARAEDRALWIAGHSLGGALAVIAALTHRDHKIAGIMTFGQPRLLGKRPARAIFDRFGGRYRRFVNRDDIVTQVPPGYSHTGFRTHFSVGGTDDLHFGIEASPPSEMGATASIGDKEMPIHEFVELQEMIDAISDEIENRPDIGNAAETGAPGRDMASEEMLDASVEGLVAGVSDHRIDAYVAEVSARAAAEISFEGLHETFSDRRDASFREAATEITDDPDATFEATHRSFDFGTEDDASTHGGIETVDMRERNFLVRLDDADEWTPPNGVRVQSRVGRIASVVATPQGVENLRTDRFTLDVEPSREAGVEELTDSVPHVKGTAVHTRPDVAERGERALVGVIDTGIDILHQAFDDSDGNSRIRAVWVQYDDSGKSPKQVDPKAFSQDYGSLYTAKDIATFRAAHQADNDATIPPGLRDAFSGHGTHVASIAAGRAFADVGDGMAPDAGIIMVAAHNASDPDNPDEPRSIGYSAAHVDALDLLKRISRGRTSLLDHSLPMVINVSLGMNAGAHDGQTTLETAFDGITDNGRTPGLVIVKSAGNEREHGGHSSIQVAEGGMVHMSWDTPANNRKLDYLEAWFEPGDHVAFTLRAPDGTVIGPVNFGNIEASQDKADYTCRLTLSEGHSDNGHNRLAISVKRKSGGAIPVGTWTLDLHALRVVSMTAMVHVWAERVRDRSVSFKQPDSEMTLSIPGTARSVVTVGACNSAFPMKLLPISSLGTTRDGRFKPELCAPGSAIVAALANSEPDAKTAKNGTSMAAPHVAGAIALAYSANEKAGVDRHANAVQIQQRLRLSTQHFSHVPHPGFGSGLLDAEKFFDEMT
ncbi:S8 family serine peptidase [Cognatiyoonia sp. IB215446]|uniref:S8 family serine peptidase n=1 Tax=Cognatiyoonia sp. IB215446 TaxID=3097355 RepID=UPI002A0C0944|nr:S8 family serine peptidase [Cognatiyoonia sp. IB215446]MDX8347403.1 S8 family serine peptidase [Cognatiyoonia sp. IB215446]